MSQAHREQAIGHAIAVARVGKVQVINAGEITELLKAAAIILIKETHDIEQLIRRYVDAGLLVFLAIPHHQRSDREVDVRELGS